MLPDTHPVIERLRQWRPRAPVERAVFDADGVLWPGDLGEDFLEWAIGSGLLGGEEAWRDYRARYPANDAQGCLALARFYRGLSPAQIDALVARFWRERPPVLTPVTTEVLRLLHAAGFEVCVVSGTVRPLLQPALRRLPIARLLALELGVGADGTFSGDTVGIATFAEGKAETLHRLPGGPRARLVVGNSRLDIAMLELAGELAWAYAPDVELRHAAEVRGWLLTDAQGD